MHLFLLVLTRSQELLASDGKNLQELWLIKLSGVSECRRSRPRSMDDDDDEGGMVFAEVTSHILVGALFFKGHQGQDQGRRGQSLHEVPGVHLPTGYQTGI